MVNPILSIVFDLFLIGAATSITAALIEEYRAGRAPYIGSGAATVRTSPEVRYAPPPSAPTDYRAVVAKTRQRRIARVRALQRAA